MRSLSSSTACPDTTFNPLPRIQAALPHPNPPKCLFLTQQGNSVLIGFQTERQIKIPAATDSCQNRYLLILEIEKAVRNASVFPASSVTPEIFRRYLSSSLISRANVSVTTRLSAESEVAVTSFPETENIPSFSITGSLSSTVRKSERWSSLSAEQGLPYQARY